METATALRENISGPAPENQITDRIDAVVHLREKYKHAKIPAPPSVKIELTGRCNLRCSFCALTTRAHQPKKETDMSFGLFKKIVDDMSSCGVEEFGMFLIGESFLNMELLEEAIAYVTSLERFTFLTTNGVLATPENIERVMRAGLKSLKFSLTTADDEQYENIVKRPAKLRHAAIANIKAARKIRDEGGFQCQLAASWIDYKDGQREKMMEAVREVEESLDIIYGLPLYSFGSLAEQGQQESGLNMPTPGNTGRIDNPADPLPCWLPFQEAHVLHTGKLTLCSFDAGLPDHNWVCGDLHTQGFMEAWNSTMAQELRAAHLRKDVTGTVCEKCALYGG